MKTPKVALSGSGGFIGSHFRRELERRDILVATNDTEITEPAHLDLFLKNHKELTHYFHFAGISSVGDCDKDPEKCHRINCTAAIDAARQIWEINPRCVFIFPSTAQIYAPSVEPLGEESAIAPISAYAETKWQAEIGLTEMARQLKGRLFILRLFNHTHHSQPPHFFLPSVYHQMMQVRQSGRAEVSLTVGNVRLYRDFGAIQDLLAALVAIVEHSDRLKDITVANVCTGTAKLLEEMIGALATALQLRLQWHVDPARIRAGEPSTIVGKSQFLQQVLPWQPRHGGSVEALISAFLTPL
jgi:nucleoside-diphosphate-sugar epimerase